jgi:2-oxoglutarate/2-oxoacid ferredoxin oxidoreductase subunit beta
MTETAIYTRPDTLEKKRMHYCPGCGHGIVHKLIAELFDELELREKTIAVAPVGCSVLAYEYWDVDCSEAAHGRAPAVATGIKRFRPDAFVLAYQGDGDIASIGIAEVIHAANRGENITIVFINNTIYGMTGGQMAPTTLPGQVTVTSLEGRDPKTMGYPIRMCELLNTLEAPSFIARTMIDGPGGVRKTKGLIRKAFQAQLAGLGFSVVEVLSPCPTYMRMEPVDAMKHVKETVSQYFPLETFRDRTAE